MPNHPDKHIIFGVHVTERLKHASKVQQYLSEYGCQIKTRLGLHDASDDYCSANGLLILEMVGADTKIAELKDKLNALEGVEVQQMVFEHA